MDRLVEGIIEGAVVVGGVAVAWYLSRQFYRSNGLKVREWLTERERNGQETMIDQGACYANASWDNVVKRLFVRDAYTGQLIEMPEPVEVSSKFYEKELKGRMKSDGTIEVPEILKLIVSES